MAGVTGDVLLLPLPIVILFRPLQRLSPTHNLMLALPPLPDLRLLVVPRVSILIG